jgi:hypothetical protein
MCISNNFYNLIIDSLRMQNCILAKVYDRSFFLFRAVFYALLSKSMREIFFQKSIIEKETEFDANVKNRWKHPITKAVNKK